MPHLPTAMPHTHTAMPTLTTDSHMPTTMARDLLMLSQLLRLLLMLRLTQRLTHGCTTVVFMDIMLMPHLPTAMPHTHTAMPTLTTDSHMPTTMARDLLMLSQLLRLLLMLRLTQRLTHGCTTVVFMDIMLMPHLPTAMPHTHTDMPTLTTDSHMPTTMERDQLMLSQLLRLPLMLRLTQRLTHGCTTAVFMDIMLMLHLLTAMLHTPTPMLTPTMDSHTLTTMENK